MKNNQGKVLCSGIIVTDHVCAPVHHMPEAGELILTDTIDLTLGGCAANVSTALAKLGTHARLVGRIGDDIAGVVVKELLEKAGVNTSGLIRTEGIATSQTLIVNVQGQDRRFIHTYGGNSKFVAGDIALEPAPEILYLGGYLLMQGCKPGELAPVLKKARTNGSKTILDVVTPGKADYLPWLEPVLPEVDYFMPNDHEGHLITGLAKPIDQAKLFRKMGAKNVLITQGDKGTLWLGEDFHLESDIFRVPFVDGSGSGDAFAAGLILALLENKSPEVALTIASAVGASCVRALGTTQGIFTRTELDEFLASHHLAVRAIR
jgi:sugar/nucleoside kinase (ribokinase family)